MYESVGHGRLFLENAEASLALPSEPEPSSVVLVWSCNQMGESDQSFARLHEDHTWLETAGEREEAPHHIR